MTRVEVVLQGSDNLRNNSKGSGRNLRKATKPKKTTNQIVEN
jgi:hypothetical protein